MAEFYAQQTAKRETWYREPWMWLVVGGPLVVIVAGFTTLYLAMHGADKVVAKDYYKQGININRAIEQDAQARKFSLSAELHTSTDSGKILLNLQGKTRLPDSLKLLINTGAGKSDFEDTQEISLQQIAQGLYEGKLASLAKSRSPYWHIIIQGNDWRLTGDWHHPLQQPTRLSPPENNNTHSGEKLP